MYRRQQCSASGFLYSMTPTASLPYVQSFPSSTADSREAEKIPVNVMEQRIDWHEILPLSRRPGSKSSMKWDAFSLALLPAATISPLSSVADFQEWRAIKKVDWSSYPARVAWRYSPAVHWSVAFEDLLASEVRNYFPWELRFVGLSSCSFSKDK